MREWGSTQKKKLFHFRFNVLHNFYLERKIENKIEKKKCLVRGSKFVSTEGIIETSAGMIFYADNNFSSFSLKFIHSTLINMWFFETTRIMHTQMNSSLKYGWTLKTSYQLYNLNFIGIYNIINLRTYYTYAQRMSTIAIIAFS